MYEKLIEEKKNDNSLTSSDKESIFNGIKVIVMCVDIFFTSSLHEQLSHLFSTIESVSSLFTPLQLVCIIKMHMIFRNGYKHGKDSFKS